MVRLTLIVCGLLAAPAAVTVIVAEYVPAASEAVLYCTVWVFAAPVAEPLAGETVSQVSPLVIV